MRYSFVWRPSLVGDIRATQQLLGHEDIATTANIYVAPNEASLERKLRDVYEGADN